MPLFEAGKPVACGRTSCNLCHFRRVIGLRGDIDVARFCVPEGRVMLAVDFSPRWVTQRKAHRVAMLQAVSRNHPERLYFVSPTKTGQSTSPVARRCRVALFEEGEPTEAERSGGGGLQNQTASVMAFSIRAFKLVPLSFALVAALRWRSGLMRRESVPE